FDGERTVRTSNMLQTGEFGYHKFAVFLKIFHTNFQNIIVIAAHVETFQYFRKFDDFPFKLGDVFLSVLCYFYMAKRNKVFLNFFFIYESDVLFNNFLYFKLFNSLKNCGYRQMKFAR